jgi:hypothetical protein
VVKILLGLSHFLLHVLAQSGRDLELLGRQLNLHSGKILAVGPRAVNECDVTASRPPVDSMEWNLYSDIRFREIIPGVRGRVGGGPSVEWLDILINSYKIYIYPVDNRVIHICE